jgi:hypothetical protein
MINCSYEKLFAIFKYDTFTCNNLLIYYRYTNILYYTLYDSGNLLTVFLNYNFQVTGSI